MLNRPMNNSAQNMADKFNIKELIEFERFCRDNTLWNEMKNCYSTNSTVNISWYQGSGHGFVDASSKLKITGTHKIYNTLVWLNGNKAFALTMATVEIRESLDGTLVTILSDTKLVYRLQKINGNWYITAFESIYEKDSIVPVYPDKNLDIDASKFSGYRSSYAAMCYINDFKGLKINKELPGVDKPELIASLYEAAEKWLKE